MTLKKILQGSASFFNTPPHTLDFDKSLGELFLRHELTIQSNDKKITVGKKKYNPEHLPTAQLLFARHCCIWVQAQTQLLLLLFQEFSLIRRYKGDSIENFILTARALARVLLHSRNNSSRKEDARTRNEVHI